jgi:hypothetical protein
VRLIAFGALALYGTIKWSKLLSGGATARLLGLFALAMLLAGGRPALAKRSRLLAAVATVVALIAALPLSGVPLAWIWHMRIAVTLNAIGEGLSALPQVLVPYSGTNQTVTLVIVLGAAVLLLDGALLVAFAPGAMEELRRAGAALPLVALAAVPTTLLRPAFPYLDGAVLFGLLVAFVWGERIGRRHFGGALGLCAVATIAAMFAAPALDRHKPWFNYRGLAGSLNPSFAETFTWEQSYGPLDWPRKGRVVLEVKATRPEYWKAENLDLFNGVDWVQGSVPGVMPSPARGPLDAWSQPIQVTIRAMRISQLIGAGITEHPRNIPQGINPGPSWGTWTTGSPLGPGESYQVTVYEPEPSPAQLSGAGTDYSRLPSGYLAVQMPPSPGTPSPDSIVLPGDKASGNQPTLTFPAFHSGGSIEVLSGPAHAPGAVLIRNSQYGKAYALARRLARRAATPYQFVQGVESYLDSSRYTYYEKTPRESYPLESFLFTTHRGYCQQFAGAMALLLRMGGVPARVAVGFTPGRHDAASNTWQVTDFDAHAWDEVWFPRYGWVRFDPTPPADPARSGHLAGSTGSITNLAATGNGLSASKTTHGTAAGKRRRPASHAGAGIHHGTGGSGELEWIAPVVVAMLLVLLFVATKPLRSADALVAELEEALRRIGRPLPAGATLTWLERRVEASEDAAAYVRALRQARFASAKRLPTRGQRRALRRQLRLGMGRFGALRAAWALPPRWGTPSTPAHRRWRAPSTRYRRGGTSSTRAHRRRGA